MKILGLIPAREGSKGIPEKNLKPLKGIPVINYSINIGLQSKLIDTVLVSTDSEKIAQLSREAGASVPFIRPSHLASDKSPTIDTVIHALKYLEDRSENYDAVCILQPTVPFRILEEVDQSILKFIESGADSLVSVREVPHKYNPHWCFEEDSNADHLKIATGERQIIPRRQSLPKAYYRDGSIYLTLTDTILKGKSLYGNKITYFENTQSPDINIDTQTDWLQAENYIKAHEK